MQRLAIEQAGLPLDPRTADYFRDVNDHLVRDAERIIAFDELPPASSKPTSRS